MFFCTDLLFLLHKISFLLMGGTIALITRSEVLIVFITGYIDALVDVQSDITALN